LISARRNFVKATVSAGNYTTNKVIELSGKTFDVLLESVLLSPVRKGGRPRRRSTKRFNNENKSNTTAAMEEMQGVLAPQFPNSRQTIKFPG
jgi:hypothetical protein